MNGDTRSDPRLAGAVLLNVKEVSELIGAHPRTTWRLAATGEIPAPIRVSERIVRWRLTDMQRWLDRK